MNLVLWDHQLKTNSVECAVQVIAFNTLAGALSVLKGGLVPRGSPRTDSGWRCVIKNLPTVRYLVSSRNLSKARTVQHDGFQKRLLKYNSGELLFYRQPAVSFAHCTEYLTFGSNSCFRVFKPSVRHSIGPTAGCVFSGVNVAIVKRRRWVYLWALILGGGLEALWRVQRVHTVVCKTVAGDHIVCHGDAFCCLFSWLADDDKYNCALYILFYMGSICNVDMLSCSLRSCVRRGATTSTHTPVVISVPFGGDLLCSFMSLPPS